MNRWENKVSTVTRDEVLKYCLGDNEWQDFRIKVLKRRSTVEKLALLGAWLEQREYQGIEVRQTQVQVDNYINALKRGGQLDKEGNVVR